LGNGGRAGMLQEREYGRPRRVPGGVESQGHRRPAVGMATGVSWSDVPDIARQGDGSFHRMEIIDKWPVIGNAHIPALEDGQNP